MQRHDGRGESEASQVRVGSEGEHGGMTALRAVHTITHSFLLPLPQSTERQLQPLLSDRPPAPGVKGVGAPCSQDEIVPPQLDFTPLPEG